MSGSALLLGGAAGALGLLGYGEASERNRNIVSAQKANMEATNRAIAVQQQQLSEQAKQQADEMKREAHRLEGALRVAAGESGLGMGGSAARAEQQLESELTRNLDILQGNYDNSIAAARSQSVAPTNQTQDPMWSALSGGVSGFFGGANLSGAFPEFASTNVLGSVKNAFKL